MQSDIKKLKSENRIGEVIEECGYPLQEGERFLTGVDDPSLRVDADSGYFFWGEEKGDVIQWLQNRNKWNFKQCVKFLENRIKLPKALRANLWKETESDKGEEDSIDKTEKLDFSNWEIAAHELPGKQLVESIASIEGVKGIYINEAIDLKDWRIKQARSLAHDLAGFWEIVDGGLGSCLDATRAFPDKFTPMYGDLQGYFCGWCFSELANSELKLAHPTGFAAFEVGENYEILSNGDCAGFYCHKCAQKLLRWRKAFDLAVQYHAQERENCDENTNLCVVTRMPFKRGIRVTNK